MPRLKLNPLPGYRFECRQRVRVTDVNYGGHLAHNALAGLLHQVRIELLHGLGCTELDLGDGRTGLIQTDLALTFAAEAFMLDELTGRSEFAEVRGTTFRLCHEVRRGDELVALAELGFAGYDYAARRAVALPAVFVAQVANGGSAG
jgi:acyl-CoA thioester hydrolase